MNRNYLWLVALVFALPVAAQEAPVDEAEVVPVAEPDAAGEAAPGDEVAEAEPLADEASADADDGAPLALYGGVDLVTSYLAPAGVAEDLQSGLYRVHVGARPFDNFAVEIQGGIHEGSYGPGEYRTESYIGAFVAPYIDAFWVLELSFPIGYANSTVKTGPAAKQDLHSIAYGFEAALPLRTIAETLPDMRLTGGAMVYYQKSDAQIYGIHAGLSYTFGG